MGCYDARRQRGVAVDLCDGRAVEMLRTLVTKITENLLQVYCLQTAQSVPAAKEKLAIPLKDNTWSLKGSLYIEQYYKDSYWDLVILPMLTALSNN